VNRYSFTHSEPQHLIEASGQLHAPAALPPGKNSSTKWAGGWVSTRAGLDNLEERKIGFLCQKSIHKYTSCPARSLATYRRRRNANVKMLFYMVNILNTYM